MAIQKRDFLVSITTTEANDSSKSWKEKIEEVNHLGLERIALFPTCLERKEREELYKAVQSSKIKEIPFVHLRSDMPEKELDFLISNFKTQVFNIHTKREYPQPSNIHKHKDRTYVENTYHSLDEKELNDFSGICLDFSHLENDRLLNKKNFLYNKKVLEKYKIGCNHLSAVGSDLELDVEGFYRYDSHYLRKLSEMDYLKNYPLKYFSSFCAIELENSPKEQLEIIDYIYKSLKK